MEPQFTLADSPPKKLEVTLCVDGSWAITGTATIKEILALADAIREKVLNEAVTYGDEIHGTDSRASGNGNRNDQTD